MTLNKRWKEECTKDIYWFDHLNRAYSFECTSKRNWITQKGSNFKVMTPKPNILKLEDWNPMKSKQFDSPVFSMFRQYKEVIMSSETEVIAVLLQSNVTYLPQDIDEVDDDYHYWTYEQNNLDQVDSVLQDQGQYCFHNSPFYELHVKKLKPIEWRAHFRCYNDGEPHECKDSCRGEMRPCTSSIGSITRQLSGKGGFGWRVSYQKLVCIELNFESANNIVSAMRDCMKRKHSSDYTACIPKDHPCATEYINSVEKLENRYNTRHMIESNTLGNRPWICGYCNAHHGPGVRIIYIKKYLSNCNYCNTPQLESSHPGVLTMHTPFYIACFVCVKEVIEKHGLNRSKDYVCNNGCEVLSKVTWV